MHNLVLLMKKTANPNIKETFEDLLQMTSRLDFNEIYVSPVTY